MADVGAASERTEEAMEGVSGYLHMNLISFNFGIDKGMLEPKPWANTYAEKFESLMNIFFQDCEADLVCGCEVGAHKQGMSDRHLEHVEIRGVRYSLLQNYMTALDLCGKTPRLLREPTVTRLTACDTPDAQLVLTAVQAKKGANKAMITVMGNLNIRTLYEQRAPTLAMRVRLVQEALNVLKDYSKTALQSSPATERPEVVLLLVGNCNLTPQMARLTVANLQPTDVWQVKTTRAGLGGDVCFVKGCVATTFEVAVGRSYHDRGMRNDQHDALGLILSLPVVTKDANAVNLATSRRPNTKRSRNQPEDQEVEESGRRLRSMSRPVAAP